VEFKTPIFRARKVVESDLVAESDGIWIAGWRISHMVFMWCRLKSVMMYENAVLSHQLLVMT